MDFVNNVEMYNDDLEIIEILRTIPPLPEYNNKNILKYLEEDTIDNNVGFVVLYGDYVYTVYKFDKSDFPEGDAGLILAKSHKRYSLNQLEILHHFKSQGMKFSDRIFKVFIDHLTAIHLAETFYNVKPTE